MIVSEAQRPIECKGCGGQMIMASLPKAPVYKKARRGLCFHCGLNAETDPNGENWSYFYLSPFIERKMIAADLGIDPAVTPPSRNP